MKILEFIGINDHGPLPNGCGCPHCGAEGRYVYQWVGEDGNTYSAMAGCFKALTTGYVNSYDAEYTKVLAKAAQGKKLNGWDKSILGVVSKWHTLKHQENAGHYKAWMVEKVKTIQLERRNYMKRRGYV